MNFRVGQKVICIDLCDWPNLYREQYPALNQAVTIRSIVDHPAWPHTGLRFCEIVNPPAYYADVGETIECVFDARRFRPIVERKTDISIFQKMLTDERVDA